MASVVQFLNNCLANHNFDVSLLHKDNLLLNLCSDTYEALEKLTSNIATKYIIIFISVMVSGNYLNLFEG